MSSNFQLFHSLTKLLGIVPSAPITIGITVTVMFHSYFSIFRQRSCTCLSFGDIIIIIIVVVVFVVFVAAAAAIFVALVNASFYVDIVVVVFVALIVCHLKTFEKELSFIFCLCRTNKDIYFPFMSNK